MCQLNTSNFHTIQDECNKCFLTGTELYYTFPTNNISYLGRSIFSSSRWILIEKKNGRNKLYVSGINGKAGGGGEKLSNKSNSNTGWTNIKQHSLKQLPPFPNVENKECNSAMKQACRHTSLITAERRQSAPELTLQVFAGNGRN